MEDIKKILFLICDKECAFSEENYKNEHDFTLVVRTKYIEEVHENYGNFCDKWIKEFSTQTKTQWIVRSTWPKLKKLLYRKKFVCHHNNFNKHQETQRKRCNFIRNKEKQCTDEIYFKIKKINRGTIKNDPFLKKRLCSCYKGTLMAISDGMTYGWTSPMVPYFLSNETHIKITKNDGEWMETVTLLGAAAGLPFTILAVENLGRKKSMIFSAMLGCLCWIILLVTTNLNLVFVSRFFSGMAGDMCFVAAPMYIAEIADHRIRGFLSALIYLMMLIGILTVYSVGALAPYFVVPCIGIVLTACQFIIFPLMPESPYYYVYKNRQDTARKSLLRLRNNLDIDKELEEIETAVERQKTEKGRPQAIILIRSNRFALAIIFFLNGAQHLVGISVFLMNMHIILGEAGSIYIEPSTAAIIFAAIMLVSAVIATFFMDKFGRKFLLCTSGVLTGIVLLVMTIFFHLKNLGYDVLFISWIPAACVMIYAFTFKLGLGLVPIVVTAEIFPTTIKAVGMTLADLIYVVAAILSISIYSALFDHFGIHVPLYFFSACSFCTVFFTIFVVPETKGKTLDEIQLMLKGNKFDYN